jgi:hypothetical protein
LSGCQHGWGWEVWNDKGQFPLNYANESAQHNYIPVFPNYELVQSNGSCGSCPNVEPDFVGGYTVQAANSNSVCFGFCTNQGNDPAFLKASVASSGFGDVNGYPDTYVGYVQALAHLRDM